MLKKYASRFQMVINLGHGYTIIDWGNGEAGLYLSKGFRADWTGKSLFGKKVKRKTGTSLAASGTREELEEWVKEFVK